MDYALLHYYMEKNGDNQGDLAKAIGTVDSAVSARMRGLVQFRRDEIDIIRRRYRLTAAEIERIFFAE